MIKSHHIKLNTHWFRFFLFSYVQYSPLDCWLFVFWLLLSLSSLDSFSGRGSGHVFDRARIWGSNAFSWSSARESIWSVDNPSARFGGVAHGSLNESIVMMITLNFDFVFNWSSLSSYVSLKTIYVSEFFRVAISFFSTNALAVNDSFQFLVCS